MESVKNQVCNSLRISGNSFVYDAAKKIVNSVITEPIRDSVIEPIHNSIWVSVWDFKYKLIKQTWTK